MLPPPLFIGVVSHRGSRFAVSQGEHGLAARIQAAMPDAVVQVNTDDLLDESTTPVTSAMTQATLTAELQLDREWSHYLRRSIGPHWWATHALRWGRRAWRGLHPPGPAMVRRLLNIELSHLSLMRSGIASGAPWVLILEDDAFSADIEDLVVGLRGLMELDAGIATTNEKRPSFVNVSASFPLDELGIEHLLRPVPNGQWAGSTHRSILQAERPVTNTVCAILYSTPFLRELVIAMDALPMEPVVPIDWKLNLALMRMFETGQIAAGQCWLVEPAPITQMSMQVPAILPP